MTALRAPTGDVERWLITDKDSGGVYGVVWDVYWFNARERGAQFYMEGISSGRLEVLWYPPSQEEKQTGQYQSGAQIAEANGLKLSGTEDVQQFPPSAPKRWVQCPEIYTFKSRRNGIASSSFCGKEKGHEGKHKGWRKEWE